MPTVNKVSSVTETVDLAIKLLNISVAELAANSGVSVSQIGRFRKGERDLNTANFLKLMNAMPAKAKKVIFESLASGEYDKATIVMKLLETSNQNS